MSRFNKNESGFSAIEIVIVVVVLAAIGIAGYFVAKHVDTKKSVATAQTTSPYAGWKTYCDKTVSKGCFKYPANWAFTASPGGMVVSVTDPAETVTVYYNNSDSQDRGSGQAYSPYILGQYNLSNTTLGLKIVGFAGTSDGGIEGSFPPEIGIYNTSSLTNYPLTTGSNSTIPSIPIFSFSGDEEVAFTASPNNPINTKQQAITWANSSDVKTAIQILQSLSNSY